MDIVVDEETGAHSAQFPDIWLSIYPAGVKHEPVTGKADHYRGALLIRKGEEHVHLNAFDIDDLLRFIADKRIQTAKRVMTEQHVKMNLIRTMLALEVTPDDS